MFTMTEKWFLCVCLSVCLYTGGRGGLWWRGSQTAKPWAAAPLAEVSQVCVFRWVNASAVLRNAWNTCGVPAWGGEGLPATDHHHGNTAWSFQVRCVCGINISKEWLQVCSKIPNQFWLTVRSSAIFIFLISFFFNTLSGLLKPHSYRR